MPIYEFKCGSCGHEKEILIVKKSDMQGSHKLGCDKCKGMYEKVMSAPNHVVHGYNEDNGYSNAGKKVKKNGKDASRKS
jgi:putative FmdB family regulatory protein